MSDPESSSSPSAPIAPGAPVPGAPGGPPPNIQKLVASKRLQQAQAQVGEVVDIMRVNVEKVLERDQKISELDRRADDLQEGASQFQQHAVKLKRKYWWENIKMWIIIGVILLAVVIIVVVTTTQKEQGANGSSAGTCFLVCQKYPFKVNPFITSWDSSREGFTYNGKCIYLLNS